MPSSLNQVNLLGHLGRDAELKTLPSGSSVAHFSLATTETWNDKSGTKQDRTEWHRCVLWGKQAEAVSPYLTKGKQVYVQGRLETRSWEKEGEKKFSTEIRVDKVVLCGGGGSRSESAATDTPNEYAEPLTADSIPF